MLIVKRYLAQFYHKARIERTSLEFTSDKYIFTTNGSVIIEQGFKSVLSDDAKEADDDNQKIPKLKSGDTVIIKSIIAKQDKTKPLPYFTEGTLIRAMENIYTVVDDPKYKKFLKDGDGIGTSATRASIIDDLKKKGYLTLKGKNLYATDLAHNFLSKLPDIVKNPILTAVFESKLKDIEAGKLSLDSFEKEQKDFIRQQIPKILSTKIKFN